MIILNKHIATLGLCLILGLGSASDLKAQKVKKGAPKSHETQLREAEFYFTEGEKYYILEDFAKALVLFQKSLEISPENATVYYKIAQVHTQGDNLVQALDNINKALSLDKDNKYFFVLAADIYTQLGNFQEASALLEEMIGRISDTDQYLFELGALYLYQRRYDDALSTYDKIEDVYGLSEEIIAQKQKIYLQLNNLEKALSEGQKLIDTYPGEPAYVLKQVEILTANNREKEAIVVLNDFLSAHENAHARLVLSNLQLQDGNTDEWYKNLNKAFEDPQLDINSKVQLIAELRSQSPITIEKGLALCEKVIEAHPEEADGYAVYGDMLYASEQKSKAKAAYQKALSIDDSNFALWQNILQLLAELNKPDSVITVSEMALELFPNQGVLYYFNGSANLQKRSYPEAVWALERGKRLSTSNLGLISAFNSMLGEAYNGNKEFQKSDDAFEAVLDFDPDNYAILNNYSYYLALRQEKLDKAERMSSKTVKDNPENSTFIDTYAWVLFMQGKYKEAKKVMERAFKTSGVSAIHYEHYGDILYKLGDVDGAVEQWQKAKGLNPNAELIDKKISDRKLYE